MEIGGAYRCFSSYYAARGAINLSVPSGTNQDDGSINRVRTFRLDTGQAELFDVREIHSIQYAAGSNFWGITGVDMSVETRRVYDLETGTVREVEHVASGSTE